MYIRPKASIKLGFFQTNKLLQISLVLFEIYLLNFLTYKITY